MTSGSGSPRGPLTWQPARPHHRPALERFTCTVPKPKWPASRTRVHPKPWELAVQATVRVLRPQKDGLDGIVGMDGDDVIGVVWWAHCGPQQYKIRVVAVACSARGQGGVIADQAMEAARAAIEDHARDRAVQERYHPPHVTVFAWIHARNWSSQALFTRHGFTKGAEIKEDLLEWTCDLPLAAQVC